MGYDTGLDEPTLYEIADYLKGVRGKFIEDGTLNPISMGTDTQCLNYQIPGGMLSNLLSQLKSLNASDKFDEALAETPRVREDLGFPPLVTPTSQLVGTQAVQNVLAGERYKNVGAEVKAYCRGEYGRTPAPINPEIQKLILGDEKPIEGRYADTLPTDTFEKAQAELGETARSEEDVLSYIAFPPVAEKFFEQRKADEEKVAKYSIEKIED
jgi:oxaloacetate decarboxylase alpha subunit